MKMKARQCMEEEERLSRTRKTMIRMRTNNI